MIRVLPDAAAVADTAAEIFAASAASAIDARGRFAVALSGGETPRTLYERLAVPALRERVDWAHTHLFWGDERCVPHDDPRSNHHLVAQTLLAGVPVPAEQIHPFPCAEDPVEAALAYERTLRGFAGGEVPRFDLVLLGLGADGHTASLFPGEPALAERERMAVVARGPKDGPWRVTLTLPVLKRAARIVFLVVGAAKASALRRVLAGDGTEAPPAALVRPDLGELVWLADAAAASKLDGLPGKAAGGAS